MLVIAFKSYWILTIYLGFTCCPLLSPGFSVYMGYQLCPCLFLIIFTIALLSLVLNLIIPSYRYQQTGVTSWIYFRNQSPLLCEGRMDIFPLMALFLQFSTPKLIHYITLSPHLLYSFKKSIVIYPSELHLTTFNSFKVSFYTPSFV